MGKYWINGNSGICDKWSNDIDEKGVTYVKERFTYGLEEEDVFVEKEDIKFCDRCSQEYYYKLSRCPHCKKEKIKKHEGNKK